VPNYALKRTVRDELSYATICSGPARPLSLGVRPLVEVHVIRLVLLSLLLSAGSVSAAEQQREIPARFLGEWNANLKNCGTDLNDSRLRITADRIRFYESGGPVRAVVTQGEFDLALIAELSGEGSAWLSYKHFRLSADHTHLTDVTDNDSGLVRYRCPKNSR